MLARAMAKAERGKEAGATGGSAGALLGRFHALTGLALVTYVPFHLWQQWPALDAREAWVDRARAVGLPLGAKLSLLVLLGAHLALGFVRSVRSVRSVSAPHPTNAPPFAGLAWVQRLLGTLTLVFLVGHVVLVRWEPGPHSTVRDVYTTLTEQLGTPGWMLLHLLGVIAVCGHIGVGLGRAAVSLELARSSASQRWARYAGALCAAALLLGFLQVLAMLAIGEPLVPGLR